MSRDWTPAELQSVSDAMKSRGDMGFEEFCDYLEQCTEKVVAAHLADGDTITTRIHGTEKDIRAYYLVGSFLNIGTVDDRLVEIVAVDIYDASENAI